MKQHAILITAYKSAEQVADLIRAFPEGFHFYIHFDRKSKESLESIRKLGGSRVHLFNSYHVNYAGLNHLKAILFLCEEALKNKDNAYFHLITAEDYPVKNAEGFEDAMNSGKNYMECFSVPCDFWSGNGGLDRLSYYRPYDLFNSKKRIGSYALIGLFKLQKALRVKRPISRKHLPLNGGSTYWSLQRETVQGVINYSRTQPAFLKRLKHTFCPEEFYFQTVILRLQNSDTIVNDNLRYTDWTSGRGGYPAFLDETDFETVLASNKLFARKLDFKKSEALRVSLRAAFSESVY